MAKAVVRVYQEDWWPFQNLPNALKEFERQTGIGAELSEFGLKTTDRLDYGDWIPDHNSQTWDRWLYHKLKHGENP